MTFVVVFNDKYELKYFPGIGKDQFEGSIDEFPGVTASEDTQEATAIKLKERLKEELYDLGVYVEVLA
jgi:hypothetical protein